MNEEIIFNVAIVGDSGVGKTCLIKKFLNKNFDCKSTQTTTGVSQYFYKTSINGKKVKIIFSDTAGEEKFHSLNWISIKRADVFFIVFDLTDEVSFDNIIYWKDEIKEHFDISKVDLIMVANKCDLERKVSSKRIENFKKKNKFGTNYMFCETSAMTGEGIDKCFKELINKIENKFEHLENKNIINKNIILKNNNDDEVSIKVAIIGNENVGKTSLLKKMLDKNYDLEKSRKLPTIGVEYYLYHTSINGKKLKIEFIDTNGSERYSNLVWGSIKGKNINIFLIVFDLTDEVSFDDIIYWKNNIKKYFDLSEIDIIIVANKCDLRNFRKVSSKIIENFEKKNEFETNYMLFETSALTGEGIEVCLEGLLNKIENKYESLKIKKIKKEINLKLKNDKNNKNVSCC